MNNIDEIIKRSSILIKKYPKIQIFYNFLGSSLEKKNQIYDAEIIYTKSLELDPKNSFALINLGRISRIINDLGAKILSPQEARDKLNLKKHF